MYLSPAVDAYLTALADDRRTSFQMIRRAIFHIWPSIEERLVSAIPSYFHQGQPLLSFADRKNYMALYIGPYDLLHAFKGDLRVHDHGRSCIRFKRLDPPLMDLFERIIRYTGDQLHNSKVLKPLPAIELMEELEPEKGTQVGV